MSEAPGNPVNVMLNNKEQHVGHMFDRIARRYDFLNHFLSLGIDRVWRKRLIRRLHPYNPGHILDVATGTGDLSIALQRGLACRVTGVDVSEKMMEVGMRKVRKKKLDEKISFLTGAAEALPFDENTFDAATVAFGVRNFGHLDKGLQEIMRVLKPGSPLAILEFAMPQHRLIAALYRFYLFNLLPLLGKLISKDRYAYAYLPASIDTFPKNQDFALLLTQTGFDHVSFTPLSFGIVTLYQGVKKVP